MADQDAPAQGVDRTDTSTSTIGRIRSSTITAASKVLDANPARGMWMATGTAIAHAPNLTDLRSPTGGDLITFDANGRSARDGTAEELKSEVLVDILQRTGTNESRDSATKASRAQTRELASSNPNDPTIPPLTTTTTNTTTAPKAPWPTALKHALSAISKFILTPTGLFITLYGANVVAWGAMLFFLLLKVGPMQGDSPYSPRKRWLEIDSQILNALFCLTGFGLAPWRFRDLYWVCMWRLRKVVGDEKAKRAIHRLAERNAAWFRLRDEDKDDTERETALLERMQTFSGEVAPATKTWKMDFVVWAMVLNTLFQVGMATFMWHYSRFDRPGFGVGLFIGLGCFSSLCAGVMSWWEGRKIKLIEGPVVKKMDV